MKSLALPRKRCWPLSHSLQPALMHAVTVVSFTAADPTPAGLVVTSASATAGSKGRLWWLRGGYGRRMYGQGRGSRGRRYGHGSYVLGASPLTGAAVGHVLAGGLRLPLRHRSCGPYGFGGYYGGCDSYGY